MKNTVERDLQKYEEHLAEMHKKLFLSERALRCSRMDLACAKKLVTASKRFAKRAESKKVRSLLADLGDCVVSFGVTPYAVYIGTDEAIHKGLLDRFVFLASFPSIEDPAFFYSEYEGQDDLHFILIIDKTQGRPHGN